MKSSKTRDAAPVPLFSIVPIEVALDDRLTKMQIRVLIALLSFRNRNTNTTWAKRETLATRCGYGINTISRVTTQLVELGWLTKVGQGGWSKASHYRVTVPVMLPGYKPFTVSEPDTVSDTQNEQHQPEFEGLTFDITDGGTSKEENRPFLGGKTLSEPGTVDIPTTLAEPATVSGSETVSKPDTSTLAEPDTQRCPVRLGAKNIRDTEYGTNNNSARAQADPFQPAPVTDATMVEMHAGWQPSETAIELIVRQGPDRGFVLDSVPEFIMYWIEARDQKRSMGTWNQRFSGHCKRQWVRFEAMLKAGIPRPLAPDFFPDDETVNNLISRGIPQEFILAQVDAFRRFWVESAIAHPAWNSKFHSQTLARWVQCSRSDEHITDRITDRSWANTEASS